MSIVECVPNFSEGRNTAASGVDGVVLLDVDPGQATNRTVVTLVGEPDAVLEAAFRAIKTAGEVLDMRTHEGEHARMGATDVCPFVPVSGITMEACAELARKLGKRVGDELGIPVYLYEHAASRPERKNLAEVRKGDYEGLAEKIKDPEWKPDFGPAKFNAKSGATVIGAREFLIAYNVNLNTRDRRLASDIALDIREAGRAKRDAKGVIMRQPDGTSIKVPGKLKAVKGVGWFIEEYDRAQVSMNLVDYNTTGVHEAFDAIDQEAQQRGLRATGSELVGLIPLKAVLDAGRHYLRKQGKSTGIPERQIVETAIQSLSLHEIIPFDPDEKIIEYRLAREHRDKLLVSRSVTGFVDELSSDSPAPGGGSVAALCGSLAAGLASMVANLTVGRKGQEDVWEEMIGVAGEAQAQKDFYLHAVDEDTEAFNAVMSTIRMKAESDVEKKQKSDAMWDANRSATLVPLSVLERTPQTLSLARKVADKGNPNSLSDAGVAGLAALTAAEGAYYNVLINLGNMDKNDWTDKTRTQAQGLITRARTDAHDLARSVEERLI
jgi:glutamate formiminotransferase/formiminotetrahydrofolate cyclodeaminase